MPTIQISTDFSKVPAGRFRTDGHFSGERFREELLLPALARNEPVTVYVEGTAGYGSSFLEEAFGGLVRLRGFRPEDLKRRLKVETRDPAYRTYIDAIWAYISQAQADVRVA